MEVPSRKDTLVRGVSEFWRRYARPLGARAVWLRAQLLARVDEILPFESQHLHAVTALVGVACGLVAVAFHLAIRFAEQLLIERALGAQSGWRFLVVLMPAAGGLLAGVLLSRVVPGARGSGIPQVKQAFAVENGRVGFRDAFGKFWIAAMQIGSGASLGREGPTVHICAGVTSLIARMTSLPAKNARRLLPVGVAAGIAAAFNAPIAAVTFTIEEIVGALDHAVLSGVVIAAALAAVIERAVLGSHPVMEVRHAHALLHPAQLPVYAVLGLAGGLVSVGFTDGLLRLRTWFRGLRRIPVWTQPAVGGLVTGLLALAALSFFGATGVTGGGYETLGRALEGRLEARVLLVLGLAKLVATVFSYSSGGAGGIFAPCLFIGAMLGGAMGSLDVMLFDHGPEQLGAFALVGMGAVFAGSIRAPITSVLIIFELTGGYGLVLPLMLANMTSYVIARRLRPTPIYEALLEQDGIVLPHVEAKAAGLDRVRVRDAMTSPAVVIPARQRATEALMQLGPASLSPVPVVGPEGGVLGTVSIETLRFAAPDALVGSLARPVATVFEHEPLTRAIALLGGLDLRMIVVVEGRRLLPVGVLTVADVVRLRAREPDRGSASPRFHVGPLGGLLVRDAAHPAVHLDELLPIHEASAALASSDFGVGVIRKGDAASVLLLADLANLVSEPTLEGILLVRDLAVPAPVVGGSMSLADCARVLGQAPAAVVLDDEETRVVTRELLGKLLIDWLTHQAEAA